MKQDKFKSELKNILLNLAEEIGSQRSISPKKIGLTLIGSTLGIEELIKGATWAQRENSALNIVLIGPENNSPLPLIAANSEQEQKEKMEEALRDGTIDACVTMHYNFPLNVTTIGRVQTFKSGQKMMIASTTGLADANGEKAMLLNAIYGLATAKASKIDNPTLGILNVRGAKKVAQALNTLAENGYKFQWAESHREEKGSIMRGNDLLAGSCDVMVCDSLTGNVIMKMFSSVNSAGEYEVTGDGYGAGIGGNFPYVISILSRASSAAVVANAIKYTQLMLEGDLMLRVSEELAFANRAGLAEILDSFAKNQATQLPPQIKLARKKVDYEIAGIDVLELENALAELIANDIYAESGMGCVGPVIMISKEDQYQAEKILVAKGYC